MTRDEASGGLDMSSYSTLLEGGSSGATVRVGDANGSRLYQLIAYIEKPYMPKDTDRLPAASIKLIKTWLVQGAPADAGSAQAAFDALRPQQQTTMSPTEPAESKGPPPMPEGLAHVALANVRQPPPLRTLAMSPRAPLLAIAGHHQILLLHADSHQLLGILPFPLGQIEVLEFTRDGQRLLAAGGRPGRRGAALIYDVATGKQVVQIGAERGTVLAAAISPGQSIVALGGPAKRVRAYAAESGDLLYEITAHNDWILSIDISPDGNYLATADRGGMLGVWQADTGRNVHTLSPKAGALHQVRFSGDGKLLAIAGDNGRVQAYRVEDGRQLWSKSHGGAVLALAWSAAGTLASSGDNGLVKLWGKDGKAAGASSRLGDWLYAIAFDRTSSHVFAGDWTGRLRVMDIKTRKTVATLVPTTAVADDGT